MPTVTPVGCPAPIEIPDGVTFVVKLLPMDGYHRLQRPGYPLMQPPDWIQHETDNYQVGALGHYTWEYNGAKDNAGNITQTSAHFYVDNNFIVQIVPLNEVTWQAADGAGNGNYKCISCECCDNGTDADRAKARHNAAVLCGGVMKAFGRPADSIGTHWQYNNVYPTPDDPNRHRCPNIMLFQHPDLWAQFVATAAAIIHPAPEPVTYVPAELPDWWTADNLNDPVDRMLHNTLLKYVRVEYTALRDGVKCHAWASDKAPLTRSDLVKGEKFTGLYRFNASGVGWILTKYGTRIRANQCSPYVSLKEVTA